MRHAGPSIVVAVFLAMAGAAVNGNVVPGNLVPTKLSYLEAFRPCLVAGLSPARAKYMSDDTEPFFLFGPAVR
jgi:hypothetical protein